MEYEDNEVVEESVEEKRPDSDDDYFALREGTSTANVLLQRARTFFDISTVLVFCGHQIFEKRNQ